MASLTPSFSAALTLLSAIFVGQFSGVRSKVLATQLGPRVVETQYGKLRGVLITLTNRHLPLVDAYYGLPYASVLGGELRFMPPTSTTEKWDGIRVALKFRPVCPQSVERVTKAAAEAASMRRGKDDVGTGDGGSVSRWMAEQAERFARLLPFVERQHEECLNLNVYAPVVDRSESGLLPVVMFVHGESYDFGTGNAYDGSIMAAYGQVIVVTINYRLGIFGFLSTGDSNAPGNYALLDQVAALRWIQENIRAFGGNPNEVTVLGHGLGAALVNLLTISPVTRGRSLFKRAILQSGSALGPTSLLSDPLPYTWAVASRLNCTTEQLSPGGVGVETAVSPLRLLQCLKQVPVELLTTAADYVTTLVVKGGQRDVRSSLTRGAFGPTVDRRTLPVDDLRQYMSDRSAEYHINHAASQHQLHQGPTSHGQLGSTSTSVFANVSLLLGFAAGEGPDALFVPPSLDGGGLGYHLDSTVTAIVNSLFNRNRQTIVDVLLHQYTDWNRLEATRVLSPSKGGRTTSSSSSSRSTAETPSDLLSSAELLTDAIFSAPIIDVATLHSAAPSAPTYLYVFNYTSTTSTTAATSTSVSGSQSIQLVAPLSPSTVRLHRSLNPSSSQQQQQRDEQLLLRADDLLMYSLGGPIGDGIDPFPSAVFSRHDRLVSETIMRYWTNFIKTGNPNEPSPLAGGSKRGTNRPQSATNVGSTILDLPIWPPFNGTSQHYMLLDVKSTVRRRYRAHQMALWLDLIPRLHRSSNMDTAQDDSGSPDGSNQQQPTSVVASCDVSNRSSTGLCGSVPVERRRDVTSLPVPSSVRPVGHGRRGTTTSITPSRLHTGAQTTSPRTMLPTAVSRTSNSRASPTAAADYSISLISTVTAGCLLLTVNVLLLTCFCYKRKVRRWQRDIDALKWAREDPANQDQYAGPNHHVSASGMASDAMQLPTRSSPKIKSPTGNGFATSPSSLCSGRLSRPAGLVVDCGDEGLCNCATENGHTMNQHVDDYQSTTSTVSSGTRFEHQNNQNYRRTTVGFSPPSSGNTTYGDKVVDTPPPPVFVTPIPTSHHLYWHNSSAASGVVPAPPPPPSLHQHHHQQQQQQQQQKIESAAVNYFSGDTRPGTSRSGNGSVVVDGEVLLSLNSRTATMARAERARSRTNNSELVDVVI